MVSYFYGKVDRNYKNHKLNHNLKDKMDRKKPVELMVSMRENLKYMMIFWWPDKNQLMIKDKKLFPMLHVVFENGSGK